MHLVVPLLLLLLRIGRLATFLLSLLEQSSQLMIAPISKCRVSENEPERT